MSRRGSGSRRAVSIITVLAVLGVALVGAPGAVADVSAAQTGTAGYHDVCDDAGGDPLDLRRTELSTLSTGLRVAADSCTPWPDSALDERSLRWELSTAGASAFAEVIISRENGALTVTATRAGQVVFTGSAVRTGERGIRADVPLDTIEAPDAFEFVLRLRGTAGTIDSLPEIGLGEPRLTYPDACPADEVPVVVTAGEGRYDTAVAAARAAGLRVDRQVPEVRSFSVQGSQAFAQSALALQPAVVAVSRPTPMQRLAVTPDDPLYGQQWSLHEISTPRAWRFRTGSSARVAVVDDGVDATRVDLAGRVATGHDARFGRALPAGASSDRGGHGTAVAALISAQGDNGADMAGVDWSATIVPYRVFDAAGCSDPLDVAAAIVHATDAGVDAINLSVGTLEDIPALHDAVRFAHQQGVVQVAAAGNTRQIGNAPLYPAAYPEVIGVGATHRTARLAAYSSTGAHVHLLAPGGAGTGRAEDDILTLGEREAPPRPRVGTSFSAPLVTGAVLLYRAIDPAGPDTVADALARSATDLGAPGRDDLHGHGLLDVHRLLVQAGVNRACPPGGVPPALFADVPPGTVHHPAIDCAAWWAVAQGVSPTEYRPQVHVTRAQMATFIVRTVERATGAALPVTRDHFPDDDGNHHEQAINQLAEAGVVAGRDGRYFPNEAVTRAQMATFLARAYALVGGEPGGIGEPPFTDIAGNVHQSSIAAGFELGLVRGQTVTLYGPSSAVRRDQMGSFLTNLLGAFVRDGHLAARG